MSLLVILRQTVTELCTYVLAGLVLRTYMQCSMAAVFSPSEADSDIISDRFVVRAVPHKRVKFVIIA